ncbi:MAG: mechanosensitive ion channel [Balneolaceae bacterium]|nr:mechanosensitive ion channel [Balneolaceae bacterium]MCH8549509.1 mechanosensitive ion channel [Balneolaceae bacterium]
MEDFFGGYGDTLVPMMVDHGLSVIGAILLLIVGWTFAGWARNQVVKRASSAEKVDDTLVPIMGQVVRVFIIIVTILAVLGQFGVETTSIVAVLGASALAVGLALQGTLSNVAAGVMLLILRPFKAGDAVSVGGTMGIVDSIGLFTTEMHTFDNIGVSMPNSRVWGNEIQNLNRFPTRRVDMEFGISYRDDMDKAIAIIKEVLAEDERILPEPEPLVAVSNLGDSSVDIRVRPWTETKNVWPLRYALTKRIKERFDQDGVSIPFPQRDVHFFDKSKAKN